MTSSLDLFPTASALAGVPLPPDRVYDGKDMSDILLNQQGGKSQHEVLFFYGGARTVLLWGRIRGVFSLCFIALRPAISRTHGMLVTVCIQIDELWSKHDGFCWKRVMNFVFKMVI